MYCTRYRAWPPTRPYSFQHHITNQHDDTHTIPQTAPEIHPQDEEKKSRTTSSSAPCSPSPVDDPRHPRRPKPFTSYCTSQSHDALWCRALRLADRLPGATLGTQPPRLPRALPIVNRTAHHISRSRRVILRRPRPSPAATSQARRLPRPARVICIVQHGAA